MGIAFGISNDSNILTFIGIEDAAMHDAGCSSKDLGTGEYLRHLYTGHNYLLMGGRSFLYNVSSATMQLNTVYKWVNDIEGTMCNDSYAIYKFYEGDCFNYVMSARKVEDERFVICTSAGVEPLCKTLDYDNKTNRWMLSPNGYVDIHLYPEYTTPWLYAPPWHWVTPVMHHTSEGVLYGLGMRVSRIGMKGYFHFIKTNRAELSGLLTESDSFATDTINYAGNTYNVIPNFAGIFDTAEHVYALYSEPATETFESYNTERREYSRIGRVCKNDKGEREGAFMFTSFFETRILCGPKGFRSSGQTSGKVKLSGGYYDTYFNVIEDISEVRSSPGAKSGRFLALFTSQRGGLDGSAICAYNVHNIESTFVYNQVVQGTDIVYSHLSNPTKCVSNTRYMTESEKELRKFHMLRDPVRARANDVVFFMNDVRLNQMETDWQVEAADGNKYNVIFVSTEDGRLLKLVGYQAGREEKESYHIVEEIQVFANLRAQQLTLITDELGGRYLIMSSFADVKRVPVERCHQYVTCSSCLASRDPYCAWSEQQAQCVSTVHGICNKTANIINGTGSICDPPSSTTTEYMTSTQTTKTSASTTTTGMASTSTSSPTYDAAKLCAHDQFLYLFISLLYPLLVIAFWACGVGCGYRFSRWKSERNLVEPDS